MKKDIKISVVMQIAKKDGVLSKYALDGKTHVKSYYAEFIFCSYPEILHHQYFENSFGFGYIALHDIAVELEYLDGDFVKQDKLWQACQKTMLDLSKYAKEHNVYL